MSDKKISSNIKNRKFAIVLNVFIQAVMQVVLVLMKITFVVVV